MSLLSFFKKTAKPLVSKAVDQLNPLDNGRTWSNQNVESNNANSLKPPFQGIYKENMGFSPVSANQFIDPKSVPVPQAEDLLRTYYQDDLKRQPTQEELGRDINQYRNGKSLADIQINSIAAADEGLGFQQTPEQRQQTLDFLYRSKNKSNDLSRSIFGKNPSLGQFQSVGELVENGVPDNRIIQGLGPVRPLSSGQQARSIFKHIFGI